MKRTLFIIYFLPAILVAQIQVSDIDFKLPRDEYYQKGFIKIGGEEYFVEQGAEGTKVSLVNDDSLEFVHELSFRPTDSSLKRPSNSYDRSNSGLIYDGSTLFEIYRDYFYRVDVVRGELIEKIDLKPYGLIFQGDFYHGENYYCFEVRGVQTYDYIRLDRNTGLIDTLAKEGHVVDSKQYWISDDSSRINYYDLETNQLIELPTPFRNIEYVEKHSADETTQLILKDEDGIHLLKTDGTFQTLDCNTPDDSQLRYVSDSRLAYVLESETEFVISVVDLSNCNEVYTQSFAIVSDFLDLAIYSDSKIFNEYFIFGSPNDWQGDGQFYLYNISTDRAYEIRIPIDEVALNQSVRYDNMLYFLSYNEIHHLGFFPELYSIDLDHGRTERISQEEIYNTLQIVLGENQDDQELNVYVRLEDSASLLQVDNVEQSIKSIKDLDLYNNHGIYTDIISGIWVDHKYFFSTSKSIFVMENSVTNKVLDIELNTLGGSAFKTKGDFVFVLVDLENTLSAIKININDLSYDRTILSESESLSRNIASSDNAIVNFGAGAAIDQPQGFFDIDTEEYISIGDFGLPDSRSGYLSKNNVLFSTSSGSNTRWYFVNTITRSVNLTEINRGSRPELFPDDEGGFYFRGQNNDGKLSFIYLNPQAEITEIYEDFNHPVYSYGKKFDGHVKSLAFNAEEEEIIIVSIMEGEIRRKSIPGGYSNNSQRFFWYESDAVSFIEVLNGDAYDTYKFTFDTDPEIITPTSRDSRLVMVLEGDSYAVLVYKNAQGVLSFEQYSYETGTIEPVAELHSLSTETLESTPIKIDESNYLFGVHDGIHGYEPWIYNMISRELRLLKDIRSGLRSSWINDYSRDPISKEVYFSAVKPEGDRQLFKVDNRLVSTHELDEFSSSHVRIYPTPTNTQIHIDKDYDSITIKSVDGKIVSQIESYNKGSQISVDKLVNGLYILSAQLENQVVETGKFIIQK